MKKIQVVSAFSAVTVAAGGSEESPVIDLNSLGIIGVFSLYVALTGSGTGKFEYMLNCGQATYIIPSGADDIVTAHTVTDGPGSDGIDIFSFSPMIASAMKIKVTETGTSDSITVTAVLSMQAEY